MGRLLRSAVMGAGLASLVFASSASGYSTAFELGERKNREEVERKEREIKKEEKTPKEKPEYCVEILKLLTDYNGDGIIDSILYFIHVGICPPNQSDIPSYYLEKIPL